MVKDSNGAIVRVHRNKNYTVMSNNHLQNKELNLKAKGLMSLILSLPEDWNYSIAGLTTLSADGRDAISSTLKTLQKFGYVAIEKIREQGQFKAVYHIFESPEENIFTDTDFPIRSNRCSSSDSENPEQINTNKKVNKQSTNKGNNKPEKNTYGQFNNVFLTDEHIEKLLTIYKNENLKNKAIEILSSYKESSGKKYKNDFAVLNEFNWVYKKVFPNGQSQSKVVNINSGGSGKYANYEEKQQGV
ncbi:MAG: hypothetical protein NC311_11335 [Muribaculaceae bacterium]|nr:hypothetical protein [Muribaculaceae bacterium]